MNFFSKKLTIPGSTLFLIIVLICLNIVFTYGNTNVSHIRFGSTGDPLNGMTISWNSPGNDDIIKWGYTKKFKQRKYEAKLSTTITGTKFEYTFPTLKAGKTIYYKIYNSNNKTWTQQYTFKTASDASDNKFSFTVLGDSRSYPEEWKIISEATLETDFTLFMGDIINSGKKEKDWRDWFDFGEKFIAREPIYHCVGNHDRDRSESRFDNFFGLFTLPGNELYYSFNYGNAVFICLNTENAKDKTQYQWLLSTLETNKDQTWKIVFFHKPFYTSPSHSGEMDDYFDTWWKAFDDYEVDLIFNGHTHNYQRTKPINRNVNKTAPVRSYGSSKNLGRCQIVAGSAGAPTSKAAKSDLWWVENSVGKLRHFCNLDIDQDKLTMRAMDANHVVFDSLVLDKNYTDIIFQVDLSNKKDFYDSGAVWINLKSTNTSYKMTQTKDDNIYMFKLPPVPIGTDLQYTFSYQNGSSETNYVEETIPSDCCNENGYRFLKVPYGSITLPRIVFGSCSETPQNISFQVDLNGVRGLYKNTKVWVGSDSWNEPMYMTDSDGDNIFNKTIPIVPGTNLKYYFAYKNGSGANKNYVRESGNDRRCFNEEGSRTLWISYDDIDLAPVLFNNCDEALPPGSDITDLPDITIIGSNDSESWDGGTGSPANERVEKLIDNDITSKYLVKATNSWIEIKTNRLSQLSAYTIISGNDASERDPKDWILKGWDTKTKSWKSIHTVKDNPEWRDRVIRRSWYFENDKWFNNYRLHITDVSKPKDGMMQMQELHLFGKLGDYISE